MSNVFGIDVAAMLPGIASHLAHLGDEDQARFFQVFADELIAGCKTRHLAEMQACHINHKLTEEAREVMATIGYKEKP